MKDIQMKNLIVEMFVNYITNENSDVFYLFFLFMSEATLFKDNYIQQYANVNNSHYSNATDKSKRDYRGIDIKKSSSLMVQFAKEIIDFDSDANPSEEGDTDEEELNALNEFEIALSDCLTPLARPKPNSFISDKPLFTLDNNNQFQVINHEKKTSLNLTQDLTSFLIKSLSDNSDNNIRDYKQSILSQGIKINIHSDRTVKRSIVLIDNVISKDVNLTQ